MKPERLAEIQELVVKVSEMSSHYERKALEICKELLREFYVADWKDVIEFPPPQDDILWGYCIWSGRIELVQFVDHRNSLMSYPYNDSDSDVNFAFWMSAAMPDGPSQEEINRVSKLQVEQ